MRHADSIVQIPDFDRPLSLKGKEECHIVGKILFNLRQPIFILCSTANRCLETIKLLGLSAGLNVGKNCEFINELYLASAFDILEILKSKKKSKKIFLVVGHNPGMSDLLNIVKNKQPSHLKMEILPTCGVFVCETSINDSNLEEFNLRFKYQFAPTNFSA